MASTEAWTEASLADGRTHVDHSEGAGDGDDNVLFDMPEQINQLLHGYVCTPIVLSLRKRGLFSALADYAPQSLESIAQRLGVARQGHLAVVLRMLLSMGWLEQNQASQYKLCMDIAVVDSIPEQILRMYQIPFDEFPDAVEASGWVSHAKQHWGARPPVRAMLEGCLYVPLLLGLKLSGAFQDQPAAPLAVSAAVQEALAQKRWIERLDGTVRLSALGLCVAERSYNLGICASYRVLLVQMSVLLFGDFQELFREGGAGSEQAHVDRQLKVQGSWAQHQICFVAMEQMLRPVFDTDDLGSQPTTLCHVGCGSGHLLQRIYNFVRDHTLRGKYLVQFPLLLVGVDWNASALRETSATLQGYSHLCIYGDIGNPKLFANDLKARGIAQDEVLWVRSFLDHDRPYIPPARPQHGFPARSIRTSGVFIGADGQLIPSDEMQQNLVEHLRRWAEVVGRNGLLVLEVHAMHPDVVDAHLNRAESLCFDVLQALSGKLVTDARSWLRAAGEASLFPGDRGRRFPQALSYTRITLNHFCREQHCIRSAFPEDAAELLELEERCWAPNLRANYEQIRSRIARNPDGVFVLWNEGKLVGALYTHTLADTSLVYRFNSSRIEEQHMEGGSCQQLLAICIDPAYGQHGYGKQLIEFCLACASVSSITRVFGVTRCGNFAGKNLDELANYVASRGADGAPTDPVLAFHHENGAIISGLVSQYRPLDAANLGAGVLIEYPLATPFRTPAASRRSTVQRSATEPTLGRQDSKTPDLPRIQHAISELQCAVLGLSQSEVERMQSIGWMEAGMDSLSLMQLRTRLEQVMGTSITPEFFFEFPTPYKASHALAASVEGPSLPFATKPTGAEERDVAIIGLACKFPEADGPDQYWELLSTGKTALGPVPPGRLRVTPGLDGIGGWLRDIAAWDASFFGISEAAATMMDPQHRFMFEVTWSALEHAGLNPESVAGTRTGLYFGVFSEEYKELCGAHEELVRSPYFGTGSSSSGAAGAVANALDTRGPAVTINTACSSSLVAVSQAHKALASGECELAIAGGVNVCLLQNTLAHFRAVGIVSPNGTCRPLDAAGNGTVIGEGAGVVVCKLLSKAIADDDRVLAVIPASAVTQDGRTAVLTAPNPEAQRELLRETLGQAGLGCDELDLVELHGTATPLGDPIEVNQVTAVLEEGGRSRPVVVGSVKANLGHLFSAAGIASLIKVVLALQHEAIPPQPSFETLNPQVLRPAMVSVPKLLQQWPSSKNRHRAAIVSSFGFTGTNAQVVVREARGSSAATSAAKHSTDGGSQTSAVEQHEHILTISAHNLVSLRKVHARFAQQLCGSAKWDVEHCCFTSNVGRKHFSHRLALVVDGVEALQNALCSWTPPSAADKRPLTIAIAGTGVLCSDHIHAWVAQHATLAVEFESALAEVVGDGGSGGAHAEPEDYHRALAFYVAFSTWWAKLGVVPAFATGQGVGVLAALVVSHRISLRQAAALLGRDGEINAQKLRIVLQTENAPMKGAPGFVDWTSGSVPPADAEPSTSHVGGLGTFAALDSLSASLRTESLVLCPTLSGTLLLSTSSDSSLSTQSLRDVMAWLYTRGHDLDWTAFHRPCQHRQRKVELPTYSFDTKQLWAPLPPPASRNSGLDIGILAFEYYAPSLCMRAEDLDVLHGTKGRYTNGRGQHHITFLSDDEDAVSMAMTVVQQLVKRCGLSYSDIGRLEVGSESAVDRAKSIKSFLMALFEEEGVFDVEGVDTYNACFGGTSALFNAVNWCQSDSWNGKYAVVVCTDAAVHPDPKHLQSVGASAVAMLIGRDAKLVVEQDKVTYVKHCWDFYRPIGWHNNDALIDWDEATEQYEEALLWCQDRFSEKIGTTDLFKTYDFAAFHCNAPYHARRSLRRMCDRMYDGRTLSKAEHDILYQTHAEPGTGISAENGTTYTCPLYACLLSLVINVNENLVGKRVLCFSYGSGCAASLFGLRVQGIPLHPKEAIRELRGRRPKALSEAQQLIQLFEDTYCRFGFVPTHTADRSEGVYYLHSVDTNGIRSYIEHKRPAAVRVQKPADSKVTWIELLSEELDSQVVREIKEALEPNRIHVIMSACDNFCVGASASGRIDMQQFLDFIPEFADLQKEMEELCELPLVCLCHGATRGGGMLFVGMADCVVSTADATYGFPEIRRSVLPGVVSVAAKRRMTPQHCRHWMLTGQAFDASEAQHTGLVDTIIGSREDAHLELIQLVNRLSELPQSTLRAQKYVVKHACSAAMAVVEAGRLLVLNQPSIEVGDSIELSWRGNTAILTPNHDVCQKATARSVIASLKQHLFMVQVRSSLTAVVVDATILKFQPLVTLAELAGDKAPGLESTAAKLFDTVSACSRALHDVAVPVIVVLQGAVQGPALALALAADYRVVTRDVELDFRHGPINQLFGAVRALGSLVGDARCSRFFHETPSCIMDGERALGIGLVSALHATSTEALDTAVALCGDIESAPSDGVKASVSLLRKPTSYEWLAVTCVATARDMPTLRDNAVLPTSNPFPSQAMVMKHEPGRVRTMHILRSVSVHEFLGAIGASLDVTTPLAVVVAREGGFDDSCLTTEGVLALAEFFGHQRLRPTVGMVFHDGRQDASLLLAVLADLSLAFPSTTWRADGLSLPVYALLASRVGVAGCGRLLCRSGVHFSAHDAMEMGLVHGTVSSETDAINRIAALPIAELVQSRSSFDARTSVAAAILTEACRLVPVPELLSESTDSTWTEANGIARLQLTKWSELLHATAVLKKIHDRLTGVIIDVTGVHSETEIGDDYVGRVRMRLDVTRAARSLASLPLPICTMLHGPVSPLAASIALMSDHRIGSEDATFDFSEPILAAVVFDASVAVHSLVGPREEESLRLGRPLLSAQEALNIGLLTCVTDVGTLATEGLARLRHAREPLVACRLATMATGFRTTSYQACSFLDAAQSTTPKLAGADSHVHIVPTDSMLQIEFQGLITQATSIALRTPLQTTQSPLVLRLTLPERGLKVQDFDLAAVWDVSNALLSSKVPVVAVCHSTNIDVWCAYLPMLVSADVVLLSQETYNVLLAQPDEFGALVNRGGVVPCSDPEHALGEMIQRFSMIPLHLLQKCKSELPASCTEAARVLMDSIASEETSADTHLVDLDVEDDGVAVLELNDPAHFNAQVPKLMTGLCTRIEEVRLLAEQGKVRALVLQGKGPHFCVGAAFAETETGIGMAASNESLEALARYSVVATAIRRLPIPVLAAVHGKLIGGGVALALAADYRVCAEQTTFNFGNLPRGASPCFCMSRALPMTAGWSVAFQMYLEDKALSVEQALHAGIVHQSFLTSEDAKLAVRDVAGQFSASKRHFSPGIIARSCAEDHQRMSTEICKFIARLRVEPQHLHKVSSANTDVETLHNIGDKAVGKQGETFWVDKLRSLSVEHRREEIESLIRTAAERAEGVVIPGHDEIWGLDSLSMVELRNALQRELGEAVRLSSTALFDYPCLQALADHIETTLFPKVEGAMEVVYRAARVEPMAIVGMACRFPGRCESAEGLWRFLEGRGDGIGEIPLTRMDWRKWYDPSGEGAGKSYTNRGAFITGATLFDNGRFGISTAEAMVMDPQQRVALEVAYEALAQSPALGDARQKAAGLSVGVFAGVIATSWNLHGSLPGPQRADVGPFTASGSYASICSNRISHSLGLSGPSMTIDTACSSSLVAMDAALKSLINRDSETAVVVSVHIMTSMEAYIVECAAKMLSPRGRCATFSDDADGFARGEGCGAVVLKPLSTALEDGDGVWGVLHGAAVNQDGRTATLTAPNGPAQEQVIRTAMERAGITADDVGYVEAHGTGTPLGDPQEVGALAKVFAGRERALVVGAVKSNIGHLEGAAGMAGVIKAVLCLRQGRVPPNIHCERLNPRLEPLLEECLLEFPRESVGLEGMVYAGVSSFGFGGTNAHVVLGAAPEGTETPAQSQIEWVRAAFQWQESGHPFLGMCEKQGDVLVWTCTWDDSIVEYLSDHRVRGVPVVPGTCYAELVGRAVEEVYGDVAYELRDVQFESMMYLEEERMPTVKVMMEGEAWSEGEAGARGVTIESREEGGLEWRLHARMVLVVVEAWEERVELEEVKGRCGEAVECGDAFYETLGNAYRGDFKSLARAWGGGGEWLGEIEIGGGAEKPVMPAFLQTCAWLDASTHVGMMELDAEERLSGVYAAGVDAYRVRGTARQTEKFLWCHAQLQVDDWGSTSDIMIYDRTGRALVEIKGLKGGKMETHLRHVVSVDVWERIEVHHTSASVEQQQEAPLVVEEHGDAVLRPESVAELHVAIQARAKTQSQLPVWVVAKDEEVAAYVRSVRAEYPSWRVTCVRDSCGMGLIPEHADGDEWQHLEGSWSVRRLLPVRVLPQVCSARLRGRGELARLELVAAKRCTVEEGRVEMRVCAIGLNFRDVLNVLGMYPGDPGPPGGDCAGIVTAVGANVKAFREGDRVFGVASGSLEAYVLAHPCLIRKLPDGMSFEDAVTLPILLTTVHRSLVELAGLQRGQRVLVHAGAGGVGLTAVHYAQRLGCEVVATVGSKEKREHLQSLGVRMIASSRDAEAFRRSMEEYGPVDVVLNSLSGDFIAHSLEALKNGGHFCEVGKRGIWSDEEVAQVRPDVRFHTVALDDIMAENPEHFRDLLASAMAFPGPPTSMKKTCFPIRETVAAFEHLKQAKNIGKVVITQPPLILPASDGRYIISGGLEYMGRLVARALIEQGARHLVLLSSSRSSLPEDWELDVQPVVERCDVGEVEEVLRVIGRHGNIKGIMHAAGVLADRTIGELTADDFCTVYRPKVDGARHLHECSVELELELDFFVLFSSMASGMGSAGQANYAAANGCLDALAEERDRAGLPGLSVRWGGWTGGGMASDPMLRRFASQGFMPLSPSQGIETLMQLLSHPPGPVVTVCPLDPRKLPDTPYLSAVRTKDPTGSGEPATGESGWVEGLRRMPREERGEAIKSKIRGLTERVGGTRELGEEEQWGQAGLDSLSMVELRNALQRELGEAVRLSSTALFDYTCLQALTNHIFHVLFAGVTDAHSPLCVSTVAPEDRSVAAADAHRQTGRLEPMGLSAAEDVLARSQVFCWSFVDRWAPLEGNPRFMEIGAWLFGTTVSELFALLQPDLYEGQVPLGIIVKDEECAAVARSFVVENPVLHVTIVQSQDPIRSVPAEYTRKELKFDGDRWYVKRFEVLHYDPFLQAKPQLPVDVSDFTILITGGLGYLGRLAATELIKHGARSLVLLSSRLVELPEDWDLPVRPEVVKCDVGDRQQLEDVFRNRLNIRGIIHSAGVSQQGAGSGEWERVYRPKVLGARNLEFCADAFSLDLEFFILFSSIASLGTARQPAYSAANGCLDDIANRRCRAGLPCLSVRWGPWAGGGMLGQPLMNVGLRAGLLPLTPRYGMPLLMQALESPASAAVVSLCAMNEIGFQHLVPNLTEAALHDATTGLGKSEETLHKTRFLEPIDNPEEDFLVCLRAGQGSRSPILLVYTAHGLALGSEVVSYLSPGVPVYATQAPEWTGPALCFTSRLEHHAEVLIRKFSATGLHLVGHSFGAFLTYALADVLHRSNVSCTTTLIGPAPCASPDQTFTPLKRRALAVDLFKFGDADEQSFPLFKRVLDHEVADNKALDEQIREFHGSLQSRPLFGILRQMSFLFAKLVDETRDVQEMLHQRTCSVGATIFVCSNGSLAHIFDQVYSGGGAQDMLSGWSQLMLEVKSIEVSGSLWNFSQDEECMRRLGAHLQELDGLPSHEWRSRGAGKQSEGV